MKRYKMLRRLEGTLRSSIAIACLLFPFVFTTHAVAATPTTHIITGGNQTATGQSPPLPGNGPLSIFISVGDGDTIQLGANGQKETIDFENDAYAIVINNENLTLQGGVTINFYTPIGGLSGQFGGLITDQKTNANYDILGNYRTLIGSHNFYTGTNGIDALSTIQGEGRLNPRSGLGIANATGDRTKWFTTTLADPTSANGLNVRNLRFHDVGVDFPNYKYVNGLIGNHFQAQTESTLGDITGNAFTQINVTLNATSDLRYLAGGGIIGVRATGEHLWAINPLDTTPANAIVGEVTGNIFDGIKILTTYGNHQTVTPSDGSPTYNSAYLEGGGLIGVNAATSPSPVDGTGAPRYEVLGYAYMPKLANNFFSNIEIFSNDVLLGGGLVGLNNNSKTYDPNNVYALLPDAIGNIFGNGTDKKIDVQVAYSLRGGGVLGLNGLSSATVTLENLQDNAFAGINVATGSYLRGGGIVGLQTNDGEHKNTDYEDPSEGMQAAGAYLINASGNLFLNQQIAAGTYLHGGGVVGLRSNMGEAMLGLPDYTEGLHNNVFKGIDVFAGTNGALPGLNVQNDTNPDSDASVLKYLYGGGIVGVSGFKMALLADASNNYFDELTVNVTGNLYGGGFIGVDANDESDKESVAMIGYIRNNKFFNTSGVRNVFAEEITEIHGSSSYTYTGGGSIHGGGVIGVTNDTGIASILGVTDNDFVDLQIETEAELVGGGIIGAWANDDLGGSGGTPALASIGRVEGNLFENLKVTMGSFLEGGGIIGARSNYLAGIDSVNGNTFRNNVITAGTYIDGGGIIGVTGAATNDPVTGIRLIDTSVFTGNKVSADGIVMGGLVYSYGLTGGMTIQDSRFIDNTFWSNNAEVYGTVTVDTGTPALLPGDNDTHTLTLSATSGNLTIFNNNQITNAAGSSILGYNSLYFGTIPDPSASGTPVPDYAEANAKLIVNPARGGTVALYDPIKVNQDNDSTDMYTFHMEVGRADGTGNTNNTGHFIWGGDNLLETDGDTGTINLFAGSTTTILDGMTRDTSSWTTGLQYAGVVLNNERYTMLLDAKNFTFNLESGARLNVEGHNYWDISGNDGSMNAPAVANLNGTLHFNLNNTNPFERGQLPSPAYTDNNDFDRALLTIKVPDGGQGMVDLSGSNITLSDRITLEQARGLKDGDRFFLIEVDNDVTQTVAGDDSNKAIATGSEYDFVDNSDPNAIKFATDVTVSAGVTQEYNFTIDLNGDNAGVEENTRYLVARLVGRGGSGTFVPPDNGRITTITFLQRGSDNVPLYDMDPPCRPCNPCDPCGTARRNMSEWVRTPFAEIQGTWYRAHTGSDAYADVEGALYQGGLAAQRRLHNGRLFVGAFVDAGDANYDTYNYLAARDAAYRGNGDIESLGGGVLLRRKWNNGFRLDTMFRGGNVKNKFFSPDLIVDNAPVRYQMDDAYWGANVGLNYTKKFRRDTFDIYSRYSWLMEDGGQVVLSTTEIVDFNALHSHRLTTGGRWTVQRNSLFSWYLGAAYEHEFDAISHAVEKQSGNHYVLGGSTLRGGTGVGEVGLIMRPSERFYLTAGLEGYAGKRDGGSAFAAAQWKW